MRITIMGPTSTTITTDGPAVAVPAAAPPTAAPPAALLRMLQLSSSLCPIGAFAYSQGLETAVERGWVQSEVQLAEWLNGLGAHSLSRLDLPLLREAYAAAVGADLVQLRSIAERLLASREARELAEQERQLGSALASVLANLGVAAAEPFRGHPSASYAVCFAIGAVHFGLDLQLALTGYCFAWCEQQVSAASRLVPLGHMAAQRALSAVLAEVPRWLERALALPEAQIGSSTAGLAMSAAWHETQYTRLFRS